MQRFGPSCPSTSACFRGVRARVCRWRAKSRPPTKAKRAKLSPFSGPPAPPDRNFLPNCAHHTPRCYRCTWDVNLWFVQHHTCPRSHSRSGRAMVRPRSMACWRVQIPAFNKLNGANSIVKHFAAFLAAPPTYISTGCPPATFARVLLVRDA